MKLLLFFCIWRIKNSFLNKFINYTFKNSFEYDYLNPFLEVDEFYDKGFFSNKALSIRNIEDCLEKNKQVFDSLGLEHVKKINELKETD